MKKTYIVQLTDEEHQICLAVVKKLKGTSQKVRRANILLKADADGPHWKDQQIADAFLCSRQSVENVRKKLVTEGFDIALNGKKRDTPPRKKYWTENRKPKSSRCAYPIRPKLCTINTATPGLCGCSPKKSSSWPPSHGALRRSVEVRSNKR